MQEIEGRKGSGYFYKVIGNKVALYRGPKLWRKYNSMGSLKSSLTKMINAAAASKQRACMCCDTLFPSEGPHNRLCVKCRPKSGGMI